MKYRRLLLCLVLCLLLPAGVARADDAAIYSVDIAVTLNGDGDALIEERWDVNVVSGTEWYLALKNMRDMEILDLAVQDESGVAYENIGDWDVDRSLEEKANTCGIVRDGANYELCWGVGSYGRHEFTVRYTIGGLVKRYADAEGFLHTFVSKGLTAEVQRAAVTISSPGWTMNDENAAIWAFGYEGTVHFNRNRIVAQSDGLSQSEGIILMAEFPPGAFPGAAEGEGAFESVKQRAIEGSDYGDGEEPAPAWVWLIAAAAVLFVVGIVVIGVIRAQLPDVYYREHFGLSRAELKKTAPESGELPFGGDLPKIVGLLRLFRETLPQSGLMNYYILKWMRDGVLAASEDRRDCARLVHPPYDADGAEMALFHLLEEASDAGELTQKAVEKWAYKRHSEIEKWGAAYMDEADRSLEEAQCVTTAHAQRYFISAEVRVLDERGWQSAERLYGYRNYLLRRAAQNDGTFEADFLMYADILGIYKEVERWYREYDESDSFFAYYYISSSFRQSYSTGTSRAQGGGGSSSGGGGGGASGGGGGGSR